MAKTNNTKLKQVDRLHDHQLSLNFDKDVEPRKPRSRSEEADSQGITLYELLEREIQSNYQRWFQRGITSRQEYHDLGCSVIDHPEIYGDMECYRDLFARYASDGVAGMREVRGGARPPPPRPRAYAPWTLERKHRERIRRMQERQQTKYSIPAFYMAAVQAELARLPHYFGVCVLPGEPACTLNLQDLLDNTSKEREAALRLQGQERD